MTASAATKLIFVCLCLDSRFDVTNNSIILYLQELKANESRRAFLRFVFHEIRVPLNSISIGIQIMIESIKSASPSFEALDCMRDAVIFMGNTMNDAFAVQKLEEGALKMNFRPFVIEDHLEALKANFEIDFVAKNLTLITSIQEGCHNILVGDSYRLRHTLAVILSNAIKFSVNGSSIEISISETTTAVDPKTNDDGSWYKGFVEIRQQGSQSQSAIEPNTESIVADPNDLVILTITHL
jgi:signal transduction histidine kinase